MLCPEMAICGYSLRLCAFAGYLLVLLILSATVTFAQSLDVGAPTPVRSTTVNGKIVARDLGDSRLTDHYYRFTGTPGDLLITVQSTNLNGDLDVFTAVTLRPLLKLSLYAESTAPVTKGIYLRRREDLILRVEARSPNDDPGSYRLYFGGSFEPIPGGPDIAEAETAETEKTEPTVAGTAGTKTRRVSSVGARIEEPEPPPVTEAAGAPTPQPTPEAKPVETPTPETTAKPPERETARTTTPPRTRGRRPPPRRQPTPRTETPPVEEPKREEPRQATEEPTPKPAPEPEPEIGPRLIIETNDGTLINRPMSGVRRVTVENGQVVVTGRDGKISRFLLANVVRMQIAP